jgi:hypothetical protein
MAELRMGDFPVDELCGRSLYIYMRRRPPRWKRQALLPLLEFPTTARISPSIVSTTWGMEGARHAHPSSVGMVREEAGDSE